MAQMIFNVDSALLSELGERLVGSVHVALLELVKNAYDADAYSVKLSIDKTPDGVVTCVEDTGIGMTLDEVKKYWMRIATNNKAVNNVSRLYGRIKSGAKGIGRFSCRRLGENLTLTTTAKLSDGVYQTTNLRIDWRRFVAGTSLDSVKVEYNDSKSQTGVCGTVLRIVNSNPNVFTAKGLAYIKRHCAVLVANRGCERAGFAPDPGFNIFFRFFGEKEAPYHNLREDIIDAGWGTVTAKVGNDGEPVFSLNSIGAKIDRFVPSVRFKHIVGAKLKIGLLVDAKDQVSNPDVLTLGPMRKVLSDWGGIYVRLNGVRVQPYGQPQDDWLDIDRDRGLRRGASEANDIGDLAATLKGVEPRRYLLSLLSSRSYVGDVEIDSTMTGFEIKASREGFLDTDAFSELKLFARFAVDFATLYRDQYVQQQSERRIVDAANRFKSAVEQIEGGRDCDDHEKPSGRVETEAVDYIIKWTKKLSSNDTPDARKDVVEGIERAAELIQAHQHRNADELRRLRLVASTSILLALFAHDVKSYLVQIDNAMTQLGHIRGCNEVECDQIGQVVARLGQSKVVLQRLIDFTLAIAAPGRESKDERLNVSTRLEEVMSCLESLTNEYNVVIDISGVPRTAYVGPISKAEFFSLMINVLSNAIKAVIARNEGGERVISVSAQQMGRKCLISCCDNGIGVDLTTVESLFSSFVADPSGVLYPSLQARINREHSFVLGSGSGLGLNIARQIVNARGGDIRFVQPEGTWRTRLNIIL